jgi:hypothetical protein
MKHGSWRLLEAHALQPWIRFLLGTYQLVKKQGLSRAVWVRVAVVETKKSSAFKSEIILKFMSHVLEFRKKNSASFFNVSVLAQLNGLDVDI